ncbi:MAG: hypothetical protein ACLR0N_02385 [Bilophila wadsworthia]
MFVKWLPALAVLGVLYAYPAHAAEPLEDASEALENLDDLVKSVDSVGHSFGRTCSRGNTASAGMAGKSAGFQSVAYAKELPFPG